MGRAFEYRRAAKEKRWGKMSTVFPKLGRAITMAARQGGPDPDLNPLLRMAILNAKRENLPKDNIEAAIKRAVSKEEKDLEEIVYEGYGPHGIALMIEAATDNPTRTVANLRTYLSRGGGSLGTSGSVGFQFTRRGVFTIHAAGLDFEALELELIDAGLEELIPESDDEAVILVPFEDFGSMRDALESRNIPVLKAETQRFPNTTTALSAEQAEQVLKLVDKIEEDDDIQAVYHTMEMPDEAA
jgi:YebC/PmpR family DNA-binding regulatory protein